MLGAETLPCPASLPFDATTRLRNTRTPSPDDTEGAGASGLLVAGTNGTAGAPVSNGDAPGAPAIRRVRCLPAGPDAA